MLFLGVDGGQSHTEALIADESGRLLGRGLGGPTVGDDFIGGDELEGSIRNAVREALGASVIPEFHSAFFGLTGEFRDQKRERIEKFIASEMLSVEHDSVSAMFGAFSGGPGIIVIAGTGSVVFGRNRHGDSVRAGGMGYLFSDEGSGFGTALQVIRLAILERDGVVENQDIHKTVCEHFRIGSVDQLVMDFYSGRTKRDIIAGLSKTIQEKAEAGCNVFKSQLDTGTRELVEKVKAVAGRLQMGGGFGVAGIGGMFSGKPFQSLFKQNLERTMPQAEFREPDFGPGVGALMLAYRQAGVEINPILLENLQESLSK